jgi:hypothetical protein
MAIHFFGASFSKWRNSRASGDRVLDVKTTASTFTGGPQTLHSTGFRCWIEKVAENEKRPIFELMVDLVSGARHSLSI